MMSTNCQHPRETLTIGCHLYQRPKTLRELLPDVGKMLSLIQRDVDTEMNESEPKFTACRRLSEQDVDFFDVLVEIRY